jgi:enoyl-CoA hydratase
MNESELVSLVVEKKVAIVTLNRPDKLNALTPELFEAGCVVLDRVARNAGIAVTVLKGAGRAFCAGADLDVFRAESFTKQDGERFTELAHRFIGLLETMPQATIARIHGACFAGGLEIALGCDLIVASEEARFADTHARFGIVPVWGLSQRLPRRIGAQRALELLLTTREIDGLEAAEIGLVLKSVPADQLDAAVQALATSIAANSPRSIAAYRKLVRQSQNAGLDAGLAYERTRAWRSSPPAGATR